MAAVGGRDDRFRGHASRVGRLSARLARRLGRGERWSALLRGAAFLHDIGKLGVPARILAREGPLADDEYRIVQRHPAIGARLLSDGRSELAGLAATVALSHHERWDGRGYPRGLAGEAIPAAARIVAVADAFDAMTEERPHREAIPVDTALRELAAEAGRQFDPRVVGALLAAGESGLAGPLSWRA